MENTILLPQNKHFRVQNMGLKRTPYLCTRKRKQANTDQGRRFRKRYKIGDRSKKVSMR